MDAEKPLVKSLFDIKGNSKFKTQNDAGKAPTFTWASTSSVFEKKEMPAFENPFAKNENNSANPFGFKMADICSDDSEDEEKPRTESTKYF